MRGHAARRFVRPWAHRPETHVAGLGAIAKGISTRLPVHLLVISRVQLPLSRSAASPTFLDASNSDISISTAAVRPVAGVL